MLLRKNQSIFDAPDGFVGLYYHSFSPSNIRIPLHPFFLEVLQYYDVHISRLDPFDLAKLTTYIVMCKAYGFEPNLNAFRGFLNLGPAGDWLTFSKRGEADVPDLFVKPFTNIRAWKGQFFYIQNTIVPAEYPALRLARHPIDVQTFPEPILYMAGITEWWPQPLASAPPTQLVKNTTDFRDAHDEEGKIAVVDNHLNESVKYLIRTYKKTKKDLEAAFVKEAELKAKYNGDVMDLDENPVVVALRAEVGDKEKIAVLEAKCSGLEKEKARLGDVEAMLLKEVDDLKLQCTMLKQDRADVVAKVIPCHALEEVAAIKNHVDLFTVKCYRPTTEKEYDEAGNTYITAEYPFLKEATKDPLATLEDLFSMKP
ncbi:hypothetical protein Tco_0388564 [Tanacetum coccineum]